MFVTHLSRNQGDSCLANDVKSIFFDKNVLVATLNNIQTNVDQVLLSQIFIASSKTVNTLRPGPNFAYGSQIEKKTQKNKMQFDWNFSEIYSLWSS